MSKIASGHVMVTIDFKIFFLIFKVYFHPHAVLHYQNTNEDILGETRELSDTL